MNRRVAEALAQGDARVLGVKSEGEGLWTFRLYRETTRGLYMPLHWYLGPDTDEDGEADDSVTVAYPSFLAGTVKEFQAMMERVVTEAERARLQVIPCLSFPPVDRPMD